MVVPEVPQDPLPNQPTSLPAWLSLTVHALVVQGGPINPPEDEATIPARAPSAAAWVMVVLGRQNQAVRDDAVQQCDKEHDDERELDHFRTAFVASSRQLLRYPPTLRDPKAKPPPLHLRAAVPTSEPISTARRCDTCDVILGCRLSSVHRTYGPFGCLTRGAASENGQKDLCTCPVRASYPPTERRREQPGARALRSCPSVERGKSSVKRQTLILVMIGVILFIAGSAIAYASVQGASKHAGSGTSVRRRSAHRLSWQRAIFRPGRPEQEMVSSGLVAIELIPTKSYTATDLGSVAGPE